MTWTLEWSYNHYSDMFLLTKSCS